MFVQSDIFNWRLRDVINWDLHAQGKPFVHKNRIKKFSDVDTLRKVALPFLRKMRSCKSRG